MLWALCGVRCAAALCGCAKRHGCWVRQRLARLASDVLRKKGRVRLRPPCSPGPRGRVRVGEWEVAESQSCRRLLSCSPRRRRRHPLLLPRCRFVPRGGRRAGGHPRTTLSSKLVLVWRTPARAGDPLQVALALLRPQSPIRRTTTHRSPPLHHNLTTSPPHHLAPRTHALSLPVPTTQCSLHHTLSVVARTHGPA